MSRRDLLTDEERRALFGVLADHDALVRLYTLSRDDLELVHARRGDANRLGFAVQLALLRHPGFSTTDDTHSANLVAFMAAQIDVPASALADYGARGQTASDHARTLMADMGVRASAEADFLPMIEMAAVAAWATDKGVPIASAIVDGLRSARVLLPTLGRLERAGIAGRARARMRTYAALLEAAPPDQLTKLDALLEVSDAGVTPLAWVRDVATAPRAENVRGLIERLRFVRAVGIEGEASARVHPDRFRQLAREGRLSSAQLLASYTSARRRATLAALLIDLEARLTDAALEMADRIVGGSFTRGGNAKKRVFATTTRDVGRLMKMFHRTIDALGTAQDGDLDAFAAVDQAVGWDKLLRVRAEVEAIAVLAEEDPLVRAADRWVTLRKFAPALLEAIDFKATRGSASTLAAVETLRELNRSGRRDVPADAPMPFKKEWRTLVAEGGQIDRRLWETATMAHLRNKLRSGDVWVDRSSNYRRFDSYLLPPQDVAPIAIDLGLPATADGWITDHARELDWRLKRFAHRLARGKVEGVTFDNGKLSITPVRASNPDGVDALASRIDALMPRVRITELLHEVAGETGFASAFSNLRTHEQHDNPNALLAAILADGSNLGLARMAEASQGVTPDQLTWTQSAYIRPETYTAALARIIDTHHALPIATVWGQGTTSSSDGQFFRSGKRGQGAGEVNARYGVDPGFSFYTHVSDQHAPYHVKVISAATHEAPYVLDGLLHHGTSLAIDTHYTDTGGATDHLFALCRMLGYRFCPRLRDFPDRRLASFEPASHYASLKTIMG